MAAQKFSYKDPGALKEYLDQEGRIKPRYETKLTPIEHRRLATAVKRARHIALL